MEYYDLISSLDPKAIKARMGRKARGMWSPADDAADAFAYQDPAYQNQSFRDAATSQQANMTPWQQYAAVLGARGATTGFGKPSSIAEDPFSTFNTNRVGPRPWNEAALKGLKGAVK